MANNKEASARVKINRLLEKAGWRFFAGAAGPANIRLEQNVKITVSDLANLGDDFEKTTNGYADFTLLDEGGHPLVVLEAKKEQADPLTGKEQARSYAYNLNARFVLLSNGNLHYFWDIESGNPEVITEFPTQESLSHRSQFAPKNEDLANELVDENYIAETQDSNFQDDPRWKDEKTRADYLREKGLRILRPYQLRAVQALQKSAAQGANRFLFEMATGTGKTLVAAAVVKLFLHAGCAKRILFLVDRLELEAQADKNFRQCLGPDYRAVIYKRNRDDWNKADIVISTVQSLLSAHKSRFSPVDFDLVISDEAHRSINGDSRAVFEYFVGYKLGLTATPKDYLKNIDGRELSEKDPRAWERRRLLDTYQIFGCASGEPTFRYTLLDGVRDQCLVNPVAVDARTNITAELLSEKGMTIVVEDENGEEKEATFTREEFEKKFFSEKTNAVFCQALLNNALRDPISGEMRKTLVFCVSQRHAGKIAQMLNHIADQAWPGKYNSDFAMQVTSSVQDARQMTVNFANNKLGGTSRFKEDYKTSKTRVCVTVGMMTTGYDCEDLLNIALLRPVFSPSDFVQIKGRGTRKFVFRHVNAAGEAVEFPKTGFKFFDFFANFEYFEEKFDYDEALNLPAPADGGKTPDGAPKIDLGSVILDIQDKIKLWEEKLIDEKGMRVDRELFARAAEQIAEDADVRAAVENEQWEKAEKLAREKYEDKPELYITLDKIRKSESLDRRVTWREVLEKIFGFIAKFKSKEELLDEECDKFIAIHKPDAKQVPLIKNYLKAYVADADFRRIIDGGKFAQLNVGSAFTMADFRALDEWRNVVPQYVKDYIPLNRFME